MPNRFEAHFARAMALDGRGKRQRAIVGRHRFEMAPQRLQGIAAVVEGVDIIRINPERMVVKLQRLLEALELLLEEAAIVVGVGVAGAKRDPSSLVQMTASTGCSVSMR